MIIDGRDESIFIYVLMKLVILLLGVYLVMNILLFILSGIVISIVINKI